MTEYPVRITPAQKMSVLLVLVLRTCNILYINDSERKLRPPSLRFIRFSYGLSAIRQFLSDIVGDRRHKRKRGRNELFGKLRQKRVAFQRNVAVIAYIFQRGNDRRILDITRKRQSMRIVYQIVIVQMNTLDPAAERAYHFFGGRIKPLHFPVSDVHKRAENRFVQHIEMRVEVRTVRTSPR